MPVRKKRMIPVVGTICSRTHKGKTHKMTVVRMSDGVGYKIGKEVFKTPTAAAKSITKTEVNGWVFWGLDKK